MVIPRFIIAIIIATTMWHINAFAFAPRRFVSRRAYSHLLARSRPNLDQPTSPPLPDPKQHSPPPIYAAMAAPVASIKGVGSKTAECLQAMGLERVADVLFYFPTDVVDRTRLVLLSNATLGEVATANLTVVAARKAFNPGMPHTFVCKVNYFSTFFLRRAALCLYLTPGTVPRMLKAPPSRLNISAARWVSTLTCLERATSLTSRNALRFFP